LVSRSFFCIHSFSLFLQPPNLPPYPFALPPVRPPAQDQDPPDAARSTCLPQRSRFPISNPNSTKRKPPSPATLTRYAHSIASSPSTTLSSGKLGRLLLTNLNLPSLPHPCRLPRYSPTGKNQLKGSGFPRVKNGRRSVCEGGMGVMLKPSRPTLKRLWRSSMRG
jgi:hypothetical protein